MIPRIAYLYNHLPVSSVYLLLRWQVRTKRINCLAYKLKLSEEQNLFILQISFFCLALWLK